MLYVTNAQIDTKGMVYPRALQQTLVGCYLLIICMIGLFAIGIGADTASLGPLILMVIFLAFCVIYHGALNAAVQPLLDYLPKSLEAEEEALLAREAAATDGVTHDNGAGPSNGADTDPEKGITVHHAKPKPNLLVKFFRPDIYADYFTLRSLVPQDFADISYEPEVERDAYYQPCISATAPLLWIPRDAGGVSRQEVAHTSKVIDITDEDAYIDDKNKITWNEEKGIPPIYEEKIYY
jgi:hypothetical protein